MNLRHWNLIDAALGAEARGAMTYHLLQTPAGYRWVLCELPTMRRLLGLP